jgi:hypothetical protein
MNTPGAPLPNAAPQAPKLIDQIRSRLRLKHYSLRTEQAYVQWAKRYIIFHGKRHLAEMGKQEIEVFLMVTLRCFKLKREGSMIFPVSPKVFSNRSPSSSSISEVGVCFSLYSKPDAPAACLNRQ